MTYKEAIEALRRQSMLPTPNVLALREIVNSLEGDRRKLKAHASVILEYANAGERQPTIQEATKLSAHLE